MTAPRDPARVVVGSDVGSDVGPGLGRRAPRLCSQGVLAVAKPGWPWHLSGMIDVACANLHLWWRSF